MLQFSTGESVTVRGTGLIGRNPAMEPGEYVDDLIAIVDEGKSVSKTHLEFGQEDGAFWVSDRFSTNGTVIRMPGFRAAALRAPAPLPDRSRGTGGDRRRVLRRDLIRHRASRPSPHPIGASAPGCRRRAARPPPIRCTGAMSYSPQPERFALPALDAPTARAPFPVVATIAPVGIAVAVWAVTGSPFALLFALLGPVVALAGLLDSRLHTRRGRRAAGERALAAVGGARRSGGGAGAA